MNAELFKQYVEQLCAGDRAGARGLVFAAQDRGTPACDLLKIVIGPATEQVAKLYKSGHISTVVEHCATRINRMVAHQMQGVLARQPKSGKRMLVACVGDVFDEIGGEVMASLLEAKGWTVWCPGAEARKKDIVKLVAETKPEIVAMFGVRLGNQETAGGLARAIRSCKAAAKTEVLAVAGDGYDIAEFTENADCDMFARDVCDAIDTIDAKYDEFGDPLDIDPDKKRKRRRRRGGFVLRKNATAQATTA